MSGAHPFSFPLASCIAFGSLSFSRFPYYFGFVVDFEDALGIIMLNKFAVVIFYPIGAIWLFAEALLIIGERISKFGHYISTLFRYFAELLSTVHSFIRFIQFIPTFEPTLPKCARAKLCLSLSAACILHSIFVGRFWWFVRVPKLVWSTAPVLYFQYSFSKNWIEFTQESGRSLRFEGILSFGSSSVWNNKSSYLIMNVRMGIYLLNL